MSLFISKQEVGLQQQQLRAQVESSILEHKNGKYAKETRDAINFAASNIYSISSLLLGSIVLANRSQATLFSRIRSAATWALCPIVNIAPLFVGCFMLSPLYMPFAFGVKKYTEYCIAHKVDQLWKCAFESYEPNGLIESSDIMTVVKGLRNDPKNLFPLVEKMNFKQLYFARKVLSEKEFKACITRVGHTESHKLWRSIIATVPEIENLEKLEMLLKLHKIQVLIRKDPLIGTAICDAWESEHSQSALSIRKNSRFFLFPKEILPPSDDEVTIVVQGNREIKVNRFLLMANSSYFRNVIKGNPMKFSLIVEDLDDFENFINVINGKSIYLSRDTIKKLITLSKRYESIDLLNSLDSFIAAHSHDFLQEDLYALASNPALKNIRGLLENQLLNQKLTLDNYARYLRLSETLSFDHLGKKCADFAAQQAVA